jgi:hypothetical protein
MDGKQRFKRVRSSHLLANLMLFVMFACGAAAQQPPKLLILGPGITSPIINVNPAAPKREMPLKGWLVCNGAEVRRADYPDLFKQIGERAGRGDGATTFNLPSFPLEMKGIEPVRGMAILGTGEMAATLMPFDISSNL